MDKKSDLVNPDLPFVTTREKMVIVLDEHVLLALQSGQLDAKFDFAAQLRMAIRDSGLSQYSVPRLAKVQQGSLRLFLAGGDLKLSTFNRIALLLGFELFQNPTKMPRRMPSSRRGTAKRSRLMAPM